MCLNWCFDQHHETGHHSQGKKDPITSKLSCISPSFLHSFLFSLPTIPSFLSAETLKMNSLSKLKTEKQCHWLSSGLCSRSAGVIAGHVHLHQPLSPPFPPDLWQPLLPSASVGLTRRIMCFSCWLKAKGTTFPFTVYTVDFTWYARLRVQCSLPPWKLRHCVILRHLSTLECSASQCGRDQHECWVLLIYSAAWGLLLVPAETPKQRTAYSDLL